jgi:hypothetical protein
MKLFIPFGTVYLFHLAPTIKRAFPDWTITAEVGKMREKGLSDSPPTGHRHSTVGSSEKNLDYSKIEFF